MNESSLEYMVLVNREQHHCIWPTFKDIPKGWAQVGPVGSSEVCLAYVGKAWPDIKPLSVRHQLVEARRAETKAQT